MEPEEARGLLPELWRGGPVTEDRGCQGTVVRLWTLVLPHPPTHHWDSESCFHFKVFSPGCQNISGLPEGFPLVLPEFSPGLFASRFQPEAGVAPGRVVGATLADCSPGWEVLFFGCLPPAGRLPGALVLGSNSSLSLGKNNVSSCRLHPGAGERGLTVVR